MEEKEFVDLKGPLPLAFDAQAEGDEPNLPAFLARNSSKPVYYGFPILEDVEVNGFRLGKITDFETPLEITEGDAFIIAPDGSRAGLVWEISDTCYVENIKDFEDNRWGVWSVGFTHPMKTHEDARQNLQDIMPVLSEQWQQWKMHKKE